MNERHRQVMAMPLYVAEIFFYNKKSPNIVHKPILYGNNKNRGDKL